jgi:glycosyltransferase involved in cell wall biosynthesis
MSKIDVTIAIPVYNGETFISETINSILNQTYQNFILKIIDNNSSDRTEDIVNKFPKDKIEYIKNKTNIGMLGNWQKALCSADTKYVCILFADDKYHPKFLEKCVNEFERHPKVALVAVNKERIDDENKLVNYKKKKPIGYIKALNLYKNCFSYIGVPAPSECMLLNKVVKKLNGFNIEKINWIVDLDLYLRISEMGYDAIFLEDYLSIRRIWAGNSTNDYKFSRKHIEDRYYVLNRFSNSTYVDLNLIFSQYSKLWTIIKAAIYYNLKNQNIHEILSILKLFRKNDIRMQKYLKNLIFFSNLIDLGVYMLFKLTIFLSKRFSN